MKLNICIPGFLTLSFIILISITSFSQEQNEIKYDFSNFEPYTVEQFVENNFSTLKECYERDPSSISTGIQVIQNPVPEGSRYKPTVSVIQLYSGLLDDAVLEWAYSSGYDVGSIVYMEGYSIYESWGDMQASSISFTRHFLYNRADKTIEEDFREQNQSQNQYEKRLSGGGVVASHRISSLNGVLSSETESLRITNTRDSEMRAQRIMKPDKDAPRSEWVDYVANNSNNYSATIVLMDSKYGSWSGSTGKFNETNSVTGSIIPIRNMMGSALAFCDAKIAEAQALFYKKMGIAYVDPNIETLGNQIVVEVTANGYLTETRALGKRDLEVSEIMFSGYILDKEGSPVDSAKVSLRGFNAETITDEFGTFHLFANAGGSKAYSEAMDIKLQQIKLEISIDELGLYKEDENFGIVADGFTTLILKVKANGIRPQTVIVKQPELGSFVEQSMLKIPLVLNSYGEGEMEYVPPAYLKSDQLNKHLKTNVDPNNQYGLLSQIWVAEVPIVITYEDEDGTPGIDTLKIMVSRPPIFLMHGFTGDESTWATLGNYLRVRKYETYAREYYQGPADESTIQRQSEKLGFYIQKIRESYRDINFLQTRIDIVAHSMGGLMSRYYINNMSKYGEKAGVVIPYDVKLSREELAAARNKAAVKLIDIRKLIMVGTPNHGASMIDELFGVAGALSSDYHQLANSQLRSDSEFFKILNAGENEGRHLDPNVQYALLYGIRKRSEFYPPDRLLYPWQTSQKNFGDDDGVVKVSSAILNGILNIPFPKDWFAIHGYIHSPALQTFFMGDDAITESTTIFEEVDILLQEDIKRTPLKNSYAKIIRSDGESFMKYFSTESWNEIGLTPIKLTDNWCQLKTDEGSVNLGFFLDGHHWGSLHVLDNTIIFYEYASPEFVKVYLQKGKARFRSRKIGGGGYEVILGEEGENWYSFNPKAKVRDLETDFIIEEGNSINIQSITGYVSIGIPEKNDELVVIKEIAETEGILIETNGEIKDSPLSENGWWSEIDTSYLADEIIEEPLFIIGNDSLNIFQNLGEIELLCKDEYLPISGFTNLQINAKNDLGDTLKSPYQVVISLKHPELLSFIDIISPYGLIDSTGNHRTNITISEPNIENYTSIDEIPLSATFIVQLKHPQTLEIQFEEEWSIPIGMTLLMGQTIGPDYQPRKQALPPEFHNTSYQIANEADKDGNFFILFNTTKYDRDTEKLKKLAHRTNEDFSLDNFEFYIEWSDANSLALKYIIPDYIKTSLKAAAKLKLGNNGFFDILSPEEHEARIKHLVREFINEMPLNPENKTFVLNKLDSLFIRYNTSSFESPGFNDNLIISNVIYAPSSKNDYWSNTFIEEQEYPSLTMIMHVMGHFLQQTICLPTHRYYEFLSDQCSVSERLRLQEFVLEESLFDKSEYISFSETSADFFTYLMFKFIELNEKELSNKSIYFNLGYLDQFTISNTTQSNNPISVAHNIAGIQTSFLIDYYRDQCINNPVNVYTDFLFNQYEYSTTSKSGHPAATINEWLSTKQLLYKDNYFVSTENPITLANEYKLKYARERVFLIPDIDYTNAAVEIDGIIINDFSQIPVVNIDTNTTIKIVNGKFTLLIPNEDAKCIIKIESGTEIKIGADFSIEPLYGNLLFRTSKDFHTSLAKFIVNSSDFSLGIDEKQTTISVFDGEISITSENDDEIILSGEYTTMNKKGRIKKPKMIESPPSDSTNLIIETPFIIGN